MGQGDYLLDNHMREFDLAHERHAIDVDIPIKTIKMSETKDELPRANNLELWDKVQETDPNYTKKVSFGGNFTSINATYQIKNATEAFGMYGDTWGVESIEYEFMDVDQSQILVLARAVFKYPVNEEKKTFPISSTIFIQEFSKKWKSLQVDDEWAKKIETDITTKALSKLGFNADIFMGMYDDNKYLNTVTDKYKEPLPEPTPVLTKLTDDQFGRYLECILKSTEDKEGEVITEAYLKARHTLSPEQEQELANT